MIKTLYPKLAWQNIRKNRNTFVPFAITGIIMVAMYYMLHAIKMQSDDTLFMGARTMRVILGFGLTVVAILAVIVLFYTDKFLIKQRSKEFGLYSLLGMDKKHIAKVVMYELLIIGSITILVGLAAGILFARLMFMLLLNIIQLKVDFKFRIETESVIATLTLFAAAFLVIIIVNSIRVFALKPIDLMQSSHTGEREPKAKWILAIIGFVSLAAGYYLALNVRNPLQAMTHFFFAVLCVMAGIYLLFLTGSIAILKLMKSNKKMYYHKKRFITISGMMYRMKQNAIGLANICILSTAVLVLLSSTISLYAGIEDVLATRFPNDAYIEFLNSESNPEDDAIEYGAHYDYEQVVAALEERAKQCDVSLKNLDSYDIMTLFGYINDGNVVVEESFAETTSVISFITQDYYNEITGENISLGKDEVYVCSNEGAFDKNSQVVIGDKTYQIKGYCSNCLDLDRTYMTVYDEIQIVTNSIDELVYARELRQQKLTDSMECNILHYITFDMKGSEKNKEKFVDGLRNYICDTGIANLSTIETIVEFRPESFGMYGGLFFIGLFLGTMFLVITVMIIYYKQLSEGYEDRERFQIMQKVGMSKAEVKKVIHSQIMQVFFLPIMLAVVHIVFAFKIIKDLLAIMMFTNTPLYIGCTIGTVLVFSAVYYVVYNLTARTYYKITSQKI